MIKNIKKIVSTILIFSVLNGCAHTHEQVKHGSNVFSSEEIKLGEAIHERIVGTIPLCQNPFIASYVDRVGHTLTPFANRKNLAYRFTVLEDVRIYATHAPGGYIYVTTGFLGFLRSEVELASVLAYEIAALQHKDHRLSKWKKAAGVVVKAGTMAAPLFGLIGVLSLVGFYTINGLLLHEKPMPKQMEDADREALQYLTAAQYDPRGFLDVLHRTGNPNSEYRAFLYDFLTSHPVTAERLEHLQKAFSELPLASGSAQSGHESYFQVLQALQQPQ